MTSPLNAFSLTSFCVLNNLSSISLSLSSSILIFLSVDTYFSAFGLAFSSEVDFLASDN